MRTLNIFLFIVLCAGITTAATIKERLRRTQAQESEQQPYTHPEVTSTNQLNSSTKKQAKTVEIFVTDWCPYCVQLEQFLIDQKIKYARYDIEKSQEGSRKYKQLKSQNKSIQNSGVPVVRIGDNVIGGYSPEAILYYLNQK